MKRDEKSCSMMRTRRCPFSQFLMFPAKSGNAAKQLYRYQQLDVHSRVRAHLTVRFSHGGSREEVLLIQSKVRVRVTVKLSLSRLLHVILRHLPKLIGF